MSKGINHNLPKNKNLEKRAKELRKAGILSEVLLWLQIKGGKLKGLDFDRQKVIQNYIVDFYCAEKKVVIEIDGSSHSEKADYDERRDRYLESEGLTVIHILDGDVKQNMEAVMLFLEEHPALQ